MTAPVTIFDLPEATRRNRKKISCVFFLVCLFFPSSRSLQDFHLISFLLQYSLVAIAAILIFRGVEKTEVTSFGVFRFNSIFECASLGWNEISDVIPDEKQQCITVTGTPKGKKRLVSIVIRCPNGEFQVVLELVTRLCPKPAH